MATTNIRTLARNPNPIGPLSEVEAQLLAEEEELADSRRYAIEHRIGVMLTDRDTVGSLLMELMAGPMADSLAIAVRDAITEAGECWDGINTLGNLLYSAARARAAQELATNSRERNPS